MLRRVPPHNSHPEQARVVYERLSAGMQASKDELILGRHLLSMTILLFHTCINRGDTECQPFFAQIGKTCMMQLC